MFHHVLCQELEALQWWLAASRFTAENVYIMGGFTGYSCKIYSGHFSVKKRIMLEMNLKYYA